MVQIPVHCAGQRNEPPKSVPRPKGEQREAIAALSPPLEPPGVRAGFNGLRVSPKTRLLVWMSVANSGQFVLPRSMAPAALRRATAVASRCGTACSKIRLPQVVRTPAVAIVSLTVNGMPYRAWELLDLKSRSRRCAVALASSAQSVTIALSRGLTSLMRVR